MSLKKHFTWNLIGSGAPLLIGVFSIPYLMDKLGLELFGLLTLIWALIGYFSLFDFGLGRALTQIISKYDGDRYKSELFSSLGLMLVFYIGLFGSALILSAALFTPFSWFGIDSKYYSDVQKALMWASLGIPITTMTSGCRGILEGFFKFKESNILRIYLGIGNFLFPVIVVTFIGTTLTDVTISLIVVRLIILFLSVYEVTKNIKLRVEKVKENKKEVKELVTFGSWMTASNIVSPLMVTADRFIVSGIVGASLVAYYTVPFEVIIRILIIPAALTGAFFPHISKEMSLNIKSARLMYKEKYKLIIVSMVFLCAIVILLSKTLLTLWLGEEFASHSWYIASILVVGICLNGIAQMPHAVTQAGGNTKGVALGHIVEFLVYLPVLLLAVKYYGLVGAATAWVFRAALDLLIMTYLSRKIFSYNLINTTKL